MKNLLYLLLALASCDHASKKDPGPTSVLRAQVVNVAVRDSETKVGFVTSVAGAVFLYSATYSDNQLVQWASEQALDPRRARATASAAWLVEGRVGAGDYADTLGHFSRSFIVPDSSVSKVKGFIIWHFLSASPYAADKDIYTYTFLGRVVGKPQDLLVTVNRQRAGL